MRNFRGLTKEGKWVYGWYAFVNTRHFIIVDSQIPGVPDLDFVQTYKEGKLFGQIAKCIEVILETVGQSTGYKYKSLREAYEGDIFDAHPDGTRRFLRTIIWNDELGKFQAPYSDRSGLQLFTKSECLLYEYVDNIHQNPELMEKQ